MRYEDVTARSFGRGGRRGARCIPTSDSQPETLRNCSRCAASRSREERPPPPSHRGRNEVHKFPGRSRLQRVISWNSKNPPGPTTERRHRDRARRARKTDKKRVSRVGSNARVVGNVSASRDTNYATDTQDVKFRSYERAGLLNFSSTCPPIKIAAARNYLLISRRTRFQAFSHIFDGPRYLRVAVIRTKSSPYFARHFNVTSPRPIA